MSRVTPEPDADYRAGWHDLRHRELCVLACCLVGVPILAAFAEVPAFTGVPSGQLKYLYPMWMVAALGTMTRCTYFPCPRCKKTFFKRHAFEVNSYRSTCPHCGLRKGSADGI